MNRRVHPHFNILLSFFSSLIFMLVVFIGLPSNLFAQYKEIRDDEAKAHVGEMVTVRGVIANVRTSKAGNTFINFGRPSIYQTFTAVIFRDKAHLFRNVHSLEGKEVSVTGVIRLYKGKPEIILNEPRQLKARGNGRDSAGLRLPPGPTDSKYMNRAAPRSKANPLTYWRLSSKTLPALSGTVARALGFRNLMRSNFRRALIWSSVHYLCGLFSIVGLILGSISRSPFSCSDFGRSEKAGIFSPRY